MPIGRSIRGRNFSGRALAATPVFLSWPEEFLSSPVGVKHGGNVGTFETTFSAPEWDKASANPSATHYYVDPVNGSNSNDGLSEANPFQTIRYFFDVLDAAPPSDDVVLHLADGIYYRNTSFPGEDSWNHDVSLTMKADNEAILSSAERPSALTWTADGAAYKATRSAVLNVFDAANRDTNNVPEFLELVADVATCQATPSSYYTDGVDVWVNLHDGRFPDDDVLVCLSTGEALFQLLNDNTIFLQNLIWNFCSQSPTWVAAPRVISATGNTAALVADNCQFIGSYHNAVRTDKTATVIFNNCVAAHAGADGFNYHDDSASPNTFAVEIDCKAYNNGNKHQPYGSGINNGSTCHDGMTIIRVNTEAYNCNGPVIADVNGCNSYNAGCYAYNSTLTSGDTNAAFFANDVSATTAGVSYYDHCQGTDSDGFSLSTDSTSPTTMFVRDWQGTFDVNPNVTYSSF